jgi:hypothetical protein
VRVEIAIDKAALVLKKLNKNKNKNSAIYIT